jgi:oxygen-independent coproporphyrinogen-3 oxidase
VTEGHGDLEGWLRAIEQDLAFVREEGSFRPARGLDTLFVGGGTPSLLGADAMAGLARVLGLSDSKGAGLEWTAEANPDSFSSAVAMGWSMAGVNRVSLGVQSFQPGVLLWLRRLHDPEVAREAVRRARAAGIENINLDLMFGLPRNVPRSWAQDLDTALFLQVPHLSLYGLSVERGTPLFRDVENGTVPSPEEEDYREEYLQASELLTSEGYHHYEVSNFALPGYESRHNRAYWESAPYLGLGNGAHSHRGGRRRWNIRDWKAYQGALLAGEKPWDSEEELDAAALQLEATWLGLRTSSGLAVDGLGAAALDLVRRWGTEGWARIREGRVQLLPTGWLLLDELAVSMDAVLRSSPGPMG